MNEMEDLQLTPLGAAIVEAMPDETLKRRIQRRFERHSACPTSAIFDAEEVEQWYAAHGKAVKAIASYGLKRYPKE